MEIHAGCTRAQLLGPWDWKQTSFNKRSSMYVYEVGVLELSSSKNCVTNRAQTDTRPRTRLTYIDPQVRSCSHQYCFKYQQLSKVTTSPCQSCVQDVGAQKQSLRVALSFGRLSYG